jgi:hypothetical protein
MTILVVSLALLGLFLLVVLFLFLIIARNLKSMVKAVERATSLAETVESQGGLQLRGPARKRTMKEVFAVLPSLLKRADTLDKG